MHSRPAATAAGIDQPPAVAAKIKTASHTEFLTLPDAPAHGEPRNHVTRTLEPKLRNRNS
jgi:hypothetical protein